MSKRASPLITLLLCLSILSLHMNSAMAATGSDLVVVGYWKFDKGSGTMAFDSSGYGNDGTLVNGVNWTDGINGTALRFD